MDQQATRFEFAPRLGRRALWQDPRGLLSPAGQPALRQQPPAVEVAAALPQACASGRPSWARPRRHTTRLTKHCAQVHGPADLLVVAGREFLLHWLPKVQPDLGVGQQGPHDGAACLPGLQGRGVGGFGFGLGTDSLEARSLAVRHALGLGSTQVEPWFRSLWPAVLPGLAIPTTAFGPCPLCTPQQVNTGGDNTCCCAHSSSLPSCSSSCSCSCSSPSSSSLPDCSELEASGLGSCSRAASREPAPLRRERASPLGLLRWAAAAHTLGRASKRVLSCGGTGMGAAAQAPASWPLASASRWMAG